MTTIQAWHRSDHIFEFPDMMAAQRNRENHANGALGLWVSLTQDPLYNHKGFGTHLYQLSIEADLVHVQQLKIGDIQKLGDDPEDLALTRSGWLACKYGFIYILETDGIARQGIVIDLLKITRFSRIAE